MPPPIALAAMVQTPLATPVTVLPEIVQTLEVRLEKVTATREFVVALTVALPPAISDGAAPKVIVVG